MSKSVKQCYQYRNKERFYADFIDLLEGRDYKFKHGKGLNSRHVLRKLTAQVGMY